MERLRRHYLKPGAPLPGGIFIPEVGWNGGYAGGSRCDAIYVGFTNASGRLLVGHELKVSRADWLAELNKPGKADAWADQCHQWWLVTAPGVVHEGELPAGWGHMVPGPSKTRMKILAQPQTHLDRQPSWKAARALLARQDTLRADAIRDEVMRQTDTIRKQERERLKDNSQTAKWQSLAENAKTELQQLWKALGYQEWGRPDPDTLADLAILLRQHETLRKASSHLLNRYHGNRWERFEESLADVKAAHQAIKEQMRPTALEVEA